MNHLDLFSGIGGFALAAQTVWGSDYHCVGFCEIDPFCQQVLRKNFKGVNIYGDIRGLTAERLAADSLRGRCGQGGQCGSMEAIRGRGENHSMPPSESDCRIDLPTGGFPCQPFSTAGKRKGTQDDRFLWPEMRRVISEVRPNWIVAENVPGIIELALEQVCTDLEELGYEVQPIIVPACAVNAPHRRDRVWIVAHSTSEGLSERDGARNGAESPCGAEPERQDCPSSDPEYSGSSRVQRYESEAHAIFADDCVAIPSSNSCGKGLEGCEETRDAGSSRETAEQRLGEFPESRTFPDWTRDWREVAALTCVHRMDDGVSTRVAGLPNSVKGGYRTIPGGEEGQRLISESKWRQEALKCYGNSIVPEVAMELMKCIKKVNEWN